MTRLELALKPWKGLVLPLHHIRIVCLPGLPLQTRIMTLISCRNAIVSHELRDSGIRDTKRLRDLHLSDTRLIQVFDLFVVKSIHFEGLAVSVRAFSGTECFIKITLFTEEAKNFLHILHV